MNIKHPLITEILTVVVLIAAPFVWLALTTASTSLYTVYMVIAQLLLFLSTGPINAAIVNLVAAGERATAIALSVFAIHVLGDALSPLIVGAISDSSSLQQGVKILPVAVLIGGIVWMWAARAQAVLVTAAFDRKFPRTATIDSDNPHLPISASGRL